MFKNCPKVNTVCIKPETSFKMPPFLLHISHSYVSFTATSQLWLFICCKTRLKKNFFFEKIFVFYKIYVICRINMFLFGKKNFPEKNINENVKKIYLISDIYVIMKTMCPPGYHHNSCTLAYDVRFYMMSTYIYIIHIL